MYGESGTGKTMTAEILAQELNLPFIIVRMEKVVTKFMGETGLNIVRMKSGPKGGDQQIGAMLANGELDLIIFLRDPLTAQPHEPDVSALLRLGDVQRIPLATNVTSATIMLEALKNETFFSIVNSTTVIDE